MQPIRKERFFWWVTLPALTGVLITLAVLQYRWSNQVSAATRSQLQANLQSSLMGFRQDLARELGAACMELRAAADDAGSVRATDLSRQFLHWQQAAAHPALVKQVYLWRTAGDARLQRVDATHEHLEPAAWPEGWEPLQQRLAEMSVLTGHTESGMTHRHAKAVARGGVNMFFPWFVDQSIPALVYPLRERAASRRNEGRTRVVTWMIVELDAGVLEKEIFPELAQKYFRGASGLDYHVAVLRGGVGRVLYSSDSGFGQEGDSTHDAALPLIGPPFRRVTPGPPGPAGSEIITYFRAMGGVRPLEAKERAGVFDRLIPLEPLHESGDEGGAWELMVRHKQGSLEAAVASLRLRHLLLSFGVLLVLALTMALVLTASQRARRLATLQMSFVAGVSHELRTPLAVISSAAENLAHGVVADPAQLSRYGASILKQARQLNHLVEQVLLFASTQGKVGSYALRPVQVDEVIEAALENTAGLAEAAGMTIEQRVEPGLAPVAADFSALSQCLQNLITNAIKYGAEGHWLGIRAGARRANGGTVGIEITVSDKGPGIAAPEIKHIFEPFYRSPSVAGSNVHGTGLGLPLARTIVEAMRGSLTVASEPGRGSVFTIYLPVATAASLPEEKVAAESMPHPTAGTP
jgi:signal transduction histidine kinase